MIEYGHLFFKYGSDEGQISTCKEEAIQGWCKPETARKRQSRAIQYKVDIHLCVSTRVEPRANARP